MCTPCFASVRTHAASRKRVVIKLIAVPVRSQELILMAYFLTPNGYERWPVRSE
jgi:hypothetical protein